jgi:hypothetical protein
MKENKLLYIVFYDAFTVESKNFVGLFNEKNCKKVTLSVPNK